MQTHSAPVSRGRQIPLRPLKFALGTTRNSAAVENVELSWPRFVDRFRKPVIGLETGPEYLRLPADKQLELKDVGYYVSGQFANGTRNKTNILHRDAITVEIDHGPPDAVARIKDGVAGLGNFEFLLTSTRKHRAAAPRLRLILPLTRPVTDLEYRALARTIADSIATDDGTSSIEWFDDTGFEFTRLMFWPSVSKGESYVFELNEGDWIDPDAWLQERFVDFRDIESWPFCKRMQGKVRGDVQKMGDPLAKAGIIGAFNRCYTIHAAMDKFIPGVYAPGAHENRMTYAKGSSSNGALIYDNGLALFSRHETDPCYYQSLNAFDMVRIHLFGELDTNTEDKTITELKSYKEMRDLAMSDEQVKDEYDSANKIDLSKEFEAFEVSPAEAKQVVASPSLNVGSHLFPATEDGIALAFATGHASDFRFDHSQGKWFLWAGDRWRRDETQLAFHWTRKLLRTFAGKSDQKTLSKVSTASAVERAAKSDPRLAVAGHEWDRDRLKLCIPGGYIDLWDGTTHAADPALMMSKQTRVAPAPPGTAAPQWLKFLSEATQGDESLIRFLKQIAGYCLTGDVSREKLFFLYGPGGNGKGVFINAIANVLGDYAASANAEVFTEDGEGKHPTELARLAGARLVTAVETERDRYWAESRIKELTGNERPITARYMNQNFFEFWPQFKIVFVGNYKPALRAVTPAIVRRLYLLPFVYTPTTPDDTLKERLQDEYPAILRWMLDGLLDVTFSGFAVPRSVEEATRDYLTSEDRVQRWIDESCSQGPEREESTGRLFSSWVQWCRAEDEQPGSQRAWSVDLERLGFARRRTNTARMVVGLALRNDFNDFGGL